MYPGRLTVPSSEEDIGSHEWYKASRFVRSICPAGMVERTGVSRAIAVATRGERGAGHDLGSCDMIIRRGSGEGWCIAGYYAI